MFCSWYFVEHFCHANNHVFFMTFLLTIFSGRKNIKNNQVLFMIFSLHFFDIFVMTWNKNTKMFIKVTVFFRCFFLSNLVLYWPLAVGTLVSSWHFSKNVNCQRRWMVVSGSWSICKGVVGILLGGQRWSPGTHFRGWGWRCEGSLFCSHRPKSVNCQPKFGWQLALYRYVCHPGLAVGRLAVGSWQMAVGTFFLRWVRFRLQIGEFWIKYARALLAWERKKASKYN